LLKKRVKDEFKGVKVYGNSSIGENCIIFPGVILGFPEAEFLKLGDPEKASYPGVILGKNAIIRSYTIIYSNVKIGNNFKCGHNVLIREKTRIGNNVLVGSHSIIEGYSEIGNNVSIQSNVFIPTYTKIEDFVFIGPGAILTNDKYPIRTNEKLEGPIIRKGASIGAGAMIAPGVEIGEGAIIGMGAVVLKNIPPWKIAAGNPAKVIKDVPKNMRTLNRIRKI